MPAQEIGDFCKEHRLLFILDTAQTAGTLDIDMEKYHIDALAFTGHKGLRGPHLMSGSLLLSQILFLHSPRAKTALQRLQHLSLHP